MTIWTMQWTPKKSPVAIAIIHGKESAEKGKKPSPVSKKMAKYLQTYRHTGLLGKFRSYQLLQMLKTTATVQILKTKSVKNPLEISCMYQENLNFHSNTAIQNGESTDIISQDTPANALEDTNSALSLELEGVKAERETLQAELTKMNIALKERESKLKDELSQALKKSNEDRQREQNDFETKFANAKQILKMKERC